MVRQTIKPDMRLFVIVIFLTIAMMPLAHGQKYFSKTATIYFSSQAPLEKIEASNQNAMVVLDAGTAQMEWSVLIKGFLFQKALMQEHFNENYMESYKFPKGVFKGTILNLNDVDLTKDGKYKVNVSGDLTLHGVTKPLITSGMITVIGGKITASSSFDITVADYQIEIPKLVRDNIAKVVHVTVSADLMLMK